MQQVVRTRQTAHTVERPDYDGGTAGLGETVEPATIDVTVDAWLYQPDETGEDIDVGVRLTGDLNGLALPSADVQVNDRYTHGGVTYEVSAIEHVPNDDRPVLQQFALERMTNP